MTEATCERLLRNIEFSTTDGSRSKGVEIRLLDDFGEVERLLGALVSQVRFLDLLSTQQAAIRV